MRLLLAEVLVETRLRDTDDRIATHETLLIECRRLHAAPRGRRRGVAGLSRRLDLLARLVSRLEPLARSAGTQLGGIKNREPAALGQFVEHFHATLLGIGQARLAVVRAILHARAGIEDEDGRDRAVILQIEADAFRKMIESVVKEIPFKVVATTLRKAKSASVNDWSAICYDDGRQVIR